MVTKWKGETVRNTRVAIILSVARHRRSGFARLLSLRADETDAEEDAEEDEDEVDATSCAAGSKGRFDRPAADTRDAMLACASSLEASDKVDTVNVAAAVTSSSRTTCSAGLVCIANAWQRLMVGPHIDFSETKSNGITQAIRPQVSGSCSDHMELELDDDADDATAGAEDAALATNPPCSLSTWSWRPLHLHLTKIVKELRTLPLTEFTTGC